MKQAFLTFLVYISVSSVFGQYYATQYNGTTAYVNCGASISNSVSLANKITLETRFRMTTSPGSWDSPCGTYHDDSWTTGGFGLYYNGGTQKMNFYIFDYSSNNAAAAFDPTNTSWHHIAGTWEQSTGVISIYIDGVLSGTDNYTGSFGPVTADIFQIGAAHSLYNWKGQLDEVRVWNVVRSQAEIADNMNTQLTGAETGLIAYYQMEEGIGTSLTDNSGHSNTGTMTDGVTWVGAPTISSFTPASAAAGTAVTINGALFTGSTAVSFGGTAAASITVNSDSQISAVVGSGSSGNVVVNAPGGTASYAGFTYILPTPTVSSFSPASAATGATVTISGTNFTDATAVSFGGTAAASFSIVSATSITAVVAGGTTGTVSVTTPGGTATSTGTFTFLMAPPGNALALDGGNDFVNAGNGASVQISRGTLEAWIKTPGAGSSYRGIIVKQMAYALFLMDNVLIAYQWTGGQGAISTGINLADNRWHHVALCFDNGVNNGSFIYIDGVLVKTFTYPLANQSVALGIGNGSVSDNNQNFQGSMDEVRVWSTVRTQSEIQSGMYTELAGTESGLVVYYNINQGIAGGDNTAITILNDNSGHGINGALTNFTKTGTTSNFVESYALVVPVPAAATSITGTGFTANWTAPAAGTVTSYLLDVSTSSTFGSFVTGYAGLDCGTSLSQAVSGLTAGTTYYYRIKADKTSVTGTGGYYRTPITVTTSCTNPTSGGTIAADQAICSGTVPAAFTSSADPSGHAGTLEYQWQSSTDGISFSNLATGTYTATTYSPGSLTATTWYKRLAKVSCESTWKESNSVKITVNVLPVPAITGPAIICLNSGSQHYLTTQGMTGYTWTVSAGGTIAAGATTFAIYVTWNTAGAQTVSVNYTNAALCGATTATVYDVTVNPLPVPVITGPGGACVTSTGNVYSTAASMTGYTWTVSAGGAITAGATTNSITVTWNTAGAQTVSVKYTNGNSCTAAAATVYDVTVYPGPAIAGTTATPNAVCMGASSQLEVLHSFTGDYCIFESDYGCYFSDYISRVVIAGINRSSSCDDTYGYSFFSAPSGSLVAGTANNTYTVGTSTYRKEGAGAWIDYNHNGVFEESENLFVGYTGYVAAVYTGTFTVPADALNGPTRMRVQCKYAQALTASGACTYVGYGEIEDYIVSITGSNELYTYSWDNASTLSDVHIVNPVATPNATTTYSVIVEDSHGCTASSGTTVNANPLPVPVITGPASACVTSTGNVYSTAASMTAYTWTVSAGGAISAGATTNSITVTWNTAGAQTVSVNYTNANSCTAATATVYDVTVNPQPVPVITGPISACVTSTGNVYSTASGMTGYTWTVSAGGTITAGATTNSITVTWNTAGAKTVNVNYTNADLCNASVATVYDVTVYPGPVIVSTIAIPGGVCQGGSSQLEVLHSYTGDYCIPVSGYGCSDDDFISEVEIAGITRLSSCDNASGSNGYSFFDALSGTLVAGTANNAYTVGTSPFYEQGAGAWIDYNHNGVFEESENLFVGYANSLSAVYTGTFTVPADAHNGTTRMRVRCILGQAPVASGACTAMEYGETEDYNVSITGSNAVELYTYSWDNASTLSDAHIANPVATPNATTTYSVIVEDSHGCTASSGTTVNVNPLPAPVITGPASVCVTSTGNEYSTAASMTAYAWTVSAGGSITAGDATNAITVTWNTAGAQTVSVNYTNAPLCTTVYDVTVYPAPVITGTTAIPEVVCKGGSSQLEVLQPSTGDYCIPVSGRGCIDDDFISEVEIAGITRSSSCDNASGSNGYSFFEALSGTLVAGTANNAYTVGTSSLYKEGAGAWIDYNHNRVFEESENLFVGYTGNAAAVYSGTFTVPADALNGTTRMRVKCIFEQAPLASGACTPLDYGETEDYIVSITGGNAVELYTYSWDNASTLSDAHIANPVATPNATTTYSVIVEDLHGCTASSSTTVNVNPLPVPILSGSTSACAPSTGNEYSTAESMTGYTWTVSAGGTFTEGDPPNLIVVTWNTAGAQTVSVNYTNGNSCTAAAATVFDVTVNPLQVPVITGPASACETSTGNVYSTAAGMTDYTWAVSAGGAITAGATTNAITVTWNTAGAQTVSVNFTNGYLCTAATATVYDVAVCPVPVIVSTTASPGAVCQGGSSQLEVLHSYNGDYCIPESSSGCIYDIFISEVEIAGITRLSSCDNTSGSNGYSFFEAPSGILVAGTANNSYTVGTSPYYEEGAGAWIDYNHNGVFEASENLFVGYTGNVAAVYSGTFTVPADAVNGTTRMRVRSVFYEAPSASGACTNIGFGETEDYNVSISGSNAFGLYTYSWDNAATLSDAHIANPIATPGVATTYSVVVEDWNGCTASSGTTVNINPLPVPVITGPASACVTSTGNVYSTASGMTGYTWTVSAGRTITEGDATDAITATWNTAGAQTVSVNYTNANSCTAATATVYDVTVNLPSFVPAVRHVSDLTATGENIKWYAASTGGTALANTDVLPTGTTHYYASQTVNGVESTARLDVTATVDPTPCKPTGASTQTFSAGSTVASLQATGSNIRWYTAASGGEALATSTALVNGTHYYATQTISCAESAGRLDITAIIN